MTNIAAVVKYNPCSIYATRGVACPLFGIAVGRTCKTQESCKMPNYDGWFEDVKKGFVKCFYPNRIRLFENRKAFLLLYHTYKQGIVGEAKIIAFTVKDKTRYYWFDKFILYPREVKLSDITIDSKLAKLAKVGRWRLAYIPPATLDNIRTLSGLDCKTQEILRKELEEIAKEEPEEVHPNFFVLIKEVRRLEDLAMNEEVLKKAKEVFNEFCSKKGIKGKSKKMVFFSCLYVAYRQLHIPKRVPELAKLGNLDCKRLCSSTRLLLKNLDLKLPRLSQKEWVRYCADKLKMGSEDTQSAIKLCNKITAARVLRNRSPMSIAALSLFLTIEEKGEKIKKKDLSEACGISTACLRNLRKVWYDQVQAVERST